MKQVRLLGYNIAEMQMWKKISVEKIFEAVLLFFPTSANKNNIFSESLDQHLPNFKQNAKQFFLSHTHTHIHKHTNKHKQTHRHRCKRVSPIFVFHELCTFGFNSIREFVWRLCLCMRKSLCPLKNEERPSRENCNKFTIFASISTEKVEWTSDLKNAGRVNGCFQLFSTLELDGKEKK